jgi:hypothetical protein
MSTIRVNTIQNTSGVEVYTAKAWVNFNGTGTVAIRASGNVSSITDNGTGDYTVNFTNALADANYSATSIGPSIANGGGAFQVAQNTAAIPTASAYRLNVQTVGGTMTDNAYVSLVFFR